MQTLIQQLHFVKGLDPVADYNAAGGTGPQYSDVVEMKNFESTVFVLYKGVATGGTATGTLTVEACDDFVPTNVTAVPFFYKQTLASTDVPSALTKATTSGYAATAGSSQLQCVEVRFGDLASTGYTKVRLKVAETVNDPVVGAILVIMGNPRNLKDPYPTAIA
jgi:hypothetical protein